MKDRPLYLNPKPYTLSAIVLGYLMIGDYSANQQNAIGNWFMTIGQILECNSSIQMVIEEHLKGYTFNTNSKKYKNGKTPYSNNEPKIESIYIHKKELNDIINMLKDMINHLNDIKKD